MKTTCHHCGSRTSPTEAVRCQVCNSPGLEVEIHAKAHVMLTTWMNSNAIVPWEELVGDGPAGFTQSM